MAWCHRLQRSVQFAALLGGQDVVEHDIDVGSVGGDGVAVIALVDRLVVADLVHGAGVGQCHDPGQCGAFGAVESAGVLPDFQEDVLGDFFGEAGIAQHCTGQPEDPCSGGVVQRREGILLARRGPLQQVTQSLCGFDVRCGRLEGRSGIQAFCRREGHLGSRPPGVRIVRMRGDVVSVPLDAAAGGGGADPTVSCLVSTLSVPKRVAVRRQGAPAWCGNRHPELSRQLQTRSDALLSHHRSDGLRNYQ